MYILSDDVSSGMAMVVALTIVHAVVMVTVVDAITVSYFRN